MKIVLIMYLHNIFLYSKYIIFSHINGVDVEYSTELFTYSKRSSSINYYKISENIEKQEIMFKLVTIISVLISYCFFVEEFEARSTRSFSPNEITEDSLSKFHHSFQNFFHNCHHKICINN